MNTMNTVAIVDPAYTGLQLAGEFIARGWSVVGVLSRAGSRHRFPQAIGSADFIEVIENGGDTAGDVGNIVERLRGHGVRAVLCGAERGVEMTDLLAEKLRLPGNTTALSSCRRDKFEMAEVLRRAGIAVPRTAAF